MASWAKPHCLVFFVFFCFLLLVCHYCMPGTLTNGEFRARSLDAPDPLKAMGVKKNTTHTARLKWTAVLFHARNSDVCVCSLVRAWSFILSRCLCLGCWCSALAHCWKLIKRVTGVQQKEHACPNVASFDSDAEGGKISGVSLVPFCQHIDSN